MVARFFIAAIALAVACAPHPTIDKAGPSLALRPDSWNFGALARGEITTRTLAVANAGSDTLRMSLFSTCVCLTAAPAEAVIPPGGQRDIQVSYIGDEIKDPVTKTIFIDTNDPATPRLAFKVTGTVTPGEMPHLSAIPDPLPLDPADPLYPETRLKISNRGRESLKIGGITCFGCEHFGAPIELPGGEETVLSIFPLPDWTDRRWLEIESNDPIQPLKKIAIVELD